MRGDFSSWRDEQRQNFVGVLHQQGRVLLRLGLPQRRQVLSRARLRIRSECLLQ